MIYCLWIYISREYLTSLKTYLNCCCLVAKLHLTFETPMEYSPPGSTIHGIFQARISEWVAISFSRGPSWQGIDAESSELAGGFITNEPKRKPTYLNYYLFTNWKFVSSDYFYPFLLAPTSVSGNYQSVSISCFFFFFFQFLHISEINSICFCFVWYISLFA